MGINLFGYRIESSDFEKWPNGLQSLLQKSINLRGHYRVIMNFRVARGKIIISRETFFLKQTLPIFNLEKFTLTSSYEVFHNCETKQKSLNTILKCTSRRLLCEKRRLNMDFPHKLQKKSREIMYQQVLTDMFSEKLCKI